MDHLSEADIRPTAAERGYGNLWRKVRWRFLKKYPLCAHCGRLANLVDHIQPLRAGGTHNWDNLQSLCRSCHAVKSEAERKVVTVS
jgi:5-methylcytosine-specific restriction protein A